MKYEVNTNLIKLEMLKRGYSISKLSKESNLGKSTISRLINKKGITRPQTIQKICKALEIDVKDVIL